MLTCPIWGLFTCWAPRRLVLEELYPWSTTRRSKLDFKQGGAHYLGAVFHLWESSTIKHTSHSHHHLGLQTGYLPYKWKPSMIGLPLPWHLKAQGNYLIIRTLSFLKYQNNALNLKNTFLFLSVSLPCFWDALLLDISSVKKLESLFPLQRWAKWNTA